jgi:hypothetical protein
MQAEKGGSMNTQQLDPAMLPDPHAELERELIAEYLRGHCPRKEDWRELPEETARQLLTEASCYASSKLAEMELRARWVEKVHGTVEPGQLG